MKLQNSVIGLTVLAFFLDWHSTIIQGNYLGEENPFMRAVWQRGDWAFTAVTILCALLVIAVVILLGKMRSWALWLFIPVLVFKILIALTNYNLIPYSWTGWFQF